MTRLTTVLARLVFVDYGGLTCCAGLFVAMCALAVYQDAWMRDHPREAQWTVDACVRQKDIPDLMALMCDELQTMDDALRAAKAER